MLMMKKFEEIENKLSQKREPARESHSYKDSVMMASFERTPQ